MSYLKKNIILTNKSKGVTYGIGVLTIEKNNSGVYASFTSHDYNGPNMLLGISLGDKQVEKINVVFDANNTYNFRLPADFDINGKIGAVLVKLDGDNCVPVLWGANAMQAQVRDDIVENILSDIEPLASKVESTNKDVETLQQMNLFEEDDKMDEIIESAVDDALTEVTEDFYSLIKSQLDELFSTNNREEELENIIPDSQWVKVDFDGEGREYVVGKIYDGDELKYICYGVPGSSSIAPPENLIKYSQWLPINEMQDKGYWIMYQDATSGEALQVG